MSEEEKPKSSAPLSDKVIAAAKSEIIHGTTSYKRPPQHTRFKKGQSGNPNGRPKSDLTAGAVGNRSSTELALKEAARMITVREGDKVHQIPAIEAVHRAQYASATKGNAYAQKQIIENYQRAERARREEIRRSNEIWEWYVRRERDLHAHAARNGLPAPSRLPHPDDVRIDSERGVHLVGPFDEPSAERLKETLQLREVLVLQDALQSREPGADQAGSTAMACAMLLNQRVPARYRVSDQDWLMHAMHLQSIPKVELRRRLKADWAALGREWHPDMRLPAPSKFMSLLDQVLEELAKLNRADGS
jgi:hypothetical protein